MSVAIAKWTLDDYHRMIDVGLLDDRKVELLNGEIVEMSPEGLPHAYFSQEFGDYLKQALGDRATIRQGKPITIISSNSEPEPDLAIVQPLGREYLQHHPYPENIFWLIEFSNTSLAKDLTAKRNAYASANIQEYWVVDLKRRQLNVFRNPVDGDYRLERSLTDGEITPLAFPEMSVAVRRFLD
jgi:Uma2 family endonuclease